MNGALSPRPLSAWPLILMPGGRIEGSMLEMRKSLRSNCARCYADAMIVLHRMAYCPVLFNAPTNSCC
jgi:hypothetical protein